MDNPTWRWDATLVAAAIRKGTISSREATQSVLATQALAAAEVSEARHGLPKPVEPVP